MNKLLNNLLGMYKQAKLNKKAEEVVYDSDLIAQVLSMTKNQKEDEFSIVTLSPEKDKVLGVKYIKKDEVYDYKPNQNEYALVMTRDTGFADTDYQLQPMSMVVRSWNEGRKFYATKKNRLNKKAEEDLIEVGWGLGTNTEEEIKDNAEWGDSDNPRETDKTFWDKINKDIENVENAFLKDGYKQFFTKVRDEGHHMDGVLGGTAWMTKEQLKDFIERAENYGGEEYVLSESSGSLDLKSPIDYDESIMFSVYVYVDDKTLDSLNIESKKINKNKKQSSKKVLATKGESIDISLLLDYFKNKNKKVYDWLNEDNGSVINYDGTIYIESRYPYSVPKVVMQEIKKWAISNGYKFNGFTGWDGVKSISSKKNKLTKKASAFKVVKMTNNDFVDLSDSIKDVGDELWGILYGKIVNVIAVIIYENKVLYEPLINDEETQKIYDEAQTGSIETVELLPGDDTYADMGFVVKESSKGTKLTKKAGWKVLTPKDLTEEVKDEFLKDSIKEYAGHVKREDFYFVKGIKEKEDDQFSYEWEEGMFGEWGTNVKGEKWYSLTDLGDDWDYIYLIKEDKLYKMPNRESLTDFGVVSSKRVKLRKKAFRKLCLKRAFHKTAGEFEEMMKLKSTDPKLIAYLAKEFGVEESTVSQYTDVSENAEELYNILEQQANKYGYEWDKFEYDEYGDRIDEDDFRGDPDDLEKAVEYLKNNIDKTMFKFEYVGKYEDNYLTFSVVSEKLIPTERPVIYITHNTKNYDISLFVQTKESKEQDKAEGIESDNSLTILIRRTSDEILNEIVNYVNVELPKKIEEQNKKQSSETKAVKKQAEKVLTLKEAIGKDESEFKNMEDIVDYMNHLPLNANKSSWTVEGFGGNSIDVENLSNGEKATIKLKKNFNSRYATRQNKLFKSATIKHENGVYNVYSESGKCLGKGYKTKEEAEKRLKQVEYFKNKKAVTGTDYWGPKEIPDEEEEGTFIIRYYGGPGHIDYLRKSRNGKYHWVEQTHFDYINDKPFETTDYELAKKLVEQYGGEIEKKESKQVNNKRTSLKQVVISKMAKIKK